MPVRRRIIAVGTSALLAGGLLIGPSLPAEAAVRTPTAAPLANPGAVQTPAGWTVLGTGSWKKIAIATAPNAAGPYTVTKGKLLTKPAAWMNPAPKRGVWAPSVAAVNGAYYAYYAAVVKGSTSRRCIGTGVATSPTGPFTAYDRPLACWKSNAYDTIRSEGKGFSLIDPTPAYVGGTLVLTYKTQIRTSGRWHTTTRMLALNPAAPEQTIGNPVHADGGSVKLTDERNRYIEENPSIVEHNGKFTLFTSWGWFGTCNYQTRYRQNKNLWRGWKAKKPTTLGFTLDRNTCGFGNAQVSQDTGGQWLIFFNGHIAGDGKGPKGLYVGTVDWKRGKPRVTGIY